jgi:hypothetical protein
MPENAKRSTLIVAMSTRCSHGMAYLKNGTRCLGGKRRSGGNWTHDSRSAASS